MLTVVERPTFGLTAGQMRLRLFGRAALMSVLQASGVYLVAHGSLGAGITGFLLGWHWFGAARAVVDHRVRWARLSYALGTASGTIVALLASQALYRMHILFPQ